MNERVSRLESRVDDLTRRIEAIERRASEAPSRAESDAASGPADGAALNLQLSSLRELPMLLGRSCLVLAGAYLLRAVTAGGHWPALTGALLGAAYAAVWLFQADRTAAAEKRLSAAMHAWCAALIAFPLLWEAVGRLGALPVWATGLLWTGFSLAGIFVGARRRSTAVLLAFAGLGGLVGIGLLFVTQGAWPLAAGLLGVGLTGFVFGIRHRLHALLVPTWLLNLAAALCALVGLMSVAPVWLAPPRLAASEWAFALAYTAAVFWPSAAGRRSLAWAEVLQLAVAMSMASLSVLLPWQAAGMAATLAWAVVALTVIPWMAAGRASPVARSALHALAFLMVLYGTGLALDGRGRLLAWAGLAVCGAIAARRQPALVWAAPLFGSALAWMSGMLPLGVGRLEPGTLLPGERSAILGSETALALSLLLQGIRRDDSTRGLLARAGTLALAAVGLSALGIMTAGLGISWAGGEARLLGAAQTAVPLAVALGLLFVYRCTGSSAARLIGLCAFVAAGLQMVLRDLIGGSLGEQFFGFTVLGTGLIAATVMLRPRGRAPS